MPQMSAVCPRKTHKSCLGTTNDETAGYGGICLQCKVIMRRRKVWRLTLCKKRSGYICIDPRSFWIILMDLDGVSLMAQGDLVFLRFFWHDKILHSIISNKHHLHNKACNAWYHYAPVTVYMALTCCTMNPEEANGCIFSERIPSCPVSRCHRWTAMLLRKGVRQNGGMRNWNTELP